MARFQHVLTAFAVFISIPYSLAARGNPGSHEEALTVLPPDSLSPASVEVLDADARIFLHRNFLSDDECAYLRQKAEQRMERSGVVDSATGRSKVDSVRTSDGMFFTRAEDAVIERIERRIAAWTLLPVHYGEGLQVLRYRTQQEYTEHWDWFFDETNTRNGGNRVATVLMYLTDVEEGGETKFPRIPAPGGANPGFSECAKYSLAVRPRMGDAILFHDATLTGQLEERSLHTACPVICGTKWSMAKWIHGQHYHMGGDQYDREAEQAAEKQRALLLASRAAPASSVEL